MTRRERVAVIGAGAAGLSAAGHLLPAGHDVTVCEPGPHDRGLPLPGAAPLSTRRNPAAPRYGCQLDPVRHRWARAEALRVPVGAGA